MLENRFVGRCVKCEHPYNPNKGCWCDGNTDLPRPEERRKKYDNYGSSFRIKGMKRDIKETLGYEKG